VLCVCMCTQSVPDGNYVIVVEYIVVTTSHSLLNIVVTDTGVGG